MLNDRDPTDLGHGLHGYASGRNVQIVYDPVLTYAYVRIAKALEESTRFSSAEHSGGHALDFRIDIRSFVQKETGHF